MSEVKVWYVTGDKERNPKIHQALDGEVELITGVIGGTIIHVPHLISWMLRRMTFFPLYADALSPDGALMCTFTFCGTDYSSMLCLGLPLCAIGKFTSSQLHLHLTVIHGNLCVYCPHTCIEFISVYHTMHIIHFSVSLSVSFILTLNICVLSNYRESPIGFCLNLRRTEVVVLYYTGYKVYRGHCAMLGYTSKTKLRKIKCWMAYFLLLCVSASLKFIICLILWLYHNL